MENTESLRGSKMVLKVNYTLVYESLSLKGPILFRNLRTLWIIFLTKTIVSLTYNEPWQPKFSHNLYLKNEKIRHIYNFSLRTEIDLEISNYQVSLFDQWMSQIWNFIPTTSDFTEIFYYRVTGVHYLLVRLKSQRLKMRKKWR